MAGEGNPQMTGIKDSTQDPNRIGIGRLPCWGVGKPGPPLKVGARPPRVYAIDSSCSARRADNSLSKIPEPDLDQIA